jgi:MtN3 and saliva related transmembrane protein
MVGGAHCRYFGLQWVRRIVRRGLALKRVDQGERKKKMLWMVLGIAAASLTMFGFVPQIIKMWKTHSAKDVSGLTLVQFGTGVTLWMLYGIHLEDFIIIGANAISLATLIIALGFYLKLNDGIQKKRV